MVLQSTMAPQVSGEKREFKRKAGGTGKKGKTFLENKVSCVYFDFRQEEQADFIV